MIKFLALLGELIRLKLNMRKSPKSIHSIQQRKLKRLLKYAYKHSAYYRRTFEAAGINRSNITHTPLENFPVINKEIVIENFDDLITLENLNQNDLRRYDEKSSPDQGAYLGKYHIIHSSGSTGIPRYFLYDHKAWARMLSGIIRGAVWDLSTLEVLKILSGGIRILYLAAVNGRYGGAMAVGAGVDGLMGSRLFLDVNTPLNEWLPKIENYKPNIIIAYPSALKILAEILEERSISVNVKRVISCGEPLGSVMRTYFERIFKSVVINFYGASESLALGVGTANNQGIYLFDDLNYIEIHGDKIYLTSLYNFAQPLIRYELSDKLKPFEGEEGNLPFQRVDVLLSRNEDILWFEHENGSRDFIHPLSIEGFCLEGLLDFQFVAKGKKSFSMLAEVPDEKKRPEIESAIQSQMKKLLAEKRLENIDFSVEFVEEIFPDPATGKKRLILVEDRERSPL